MRQSHASHTTTSSNYRSLPEYWHRPCNQPANLEKWPRLHSNVCGSQEKLTTLASLQGNNQYLGLSVHIYRQYCAPTLGAWQGCIGPPCIVYSMLLEKCYEDSADQAADINGIPFSQKWSLHKLKQDGFTVLPWLCNSSSRQFGQLAPIQKVSIHSLHTPFHEANAIRTWSRLWAAYSAMVTSRTTTATSQWIREHMRRLWSSRIVVGDFWNSQRNAARCSVWTDGWGNSVVAAKQPHHHNQCGGIYWDIYLPIIYAHVNRMRHKPLHCDIGRYKISWTCGNTNKLDLPDEVMNYDRGNISTSHAVHPDDSRVAWWLPLQPVPPCHMGASYLMKSNPNHLPSSDRSSGKWEVNREGWDEKDDTWEPEKIMANANTKKRQYCKETFRQPKAKRKVRHHSASEGCLCFDLSVCFFCKVCRR